MLQTQVYRYLYETLGIRYISQAAHGVLPQSNHVIWQNPYFIPEIIFFNLDPSTDLTRPEIFDLYQKIVHAMNLKSDKVWYVDSDGRSFMDFLNWLKTQNLTAPLVVLKSEPDIQNYVQNAGTFNWVECFSLQSMIDNTNLKKPTWQVLKFLLGKV